ncbi:UDP-2,4-diacetamido-2,4,6-trideoxy-beta-L-altropyranose hydrolase [Steroidobacter flavus]|uniref:UDP-2,4-diacetamido-2,4, 6-trideoxy-beta-L-altropyranose hydrolase n=1 Tax=Steroidobacter flavus TaxID=1842136 RepID=A0ABV8T1U9_9GAMM
MTVIAIRTEASRTIGVGHAMRCLTLAAALRERGAQVHFICREYDGNCNEIIEARGFAVHRLPATGNAAVAWSGPDWPEEAAQTRAAIDALGALGVQPAWLIVDHYAIDEKVERELRSGVGRIMAIDDLANRNHDCDLLLDQNLVPRMERRYEELVTSDCVQLLGPRYCLLQPLYVELRNQTRPRVGAIRRVFAFFSGADVDNLTQLAIGAFLRHSRSDVELDVVITSAHPRADSIRAQVADHPNIHLHVDLPTLAPLLAKADLAIGAGGTTSWERACLGVPSLMITMADNQRPIAEALNERGIARWLGHKDQITEASLAAALDAVLRQELDGSWSELCYATVDGGGAARVCNAMLISASTRLRARPAGAQDEALLLEWANDPLTRRNAFSSDPIAPQSHREWFRARLSRPHSCLIFVVETEAGVPVGQVRFDREHDYWEIDYGVAAELRGRGLARPMMEVALDALRATTAGAQVQGRVKQANVPSQRVFERLGFSSQVDERGFVYRRKA